MALDVNDFKEITRIVNEENKKLYTQLSKELDFKIVPVKETLINHIKHDEKHDGDVDSKLNILCAGQTKLYAYITMGAFICAPLISYGLSKI